MTPQACHLLARIVLEHGRDRDAYRVRLVCTCGPDTRTREHLAPTRTAARRLVRSARAAHAWGRDALT